MVEQMERTKRAFFYLNSETFEVKSVECISTDSINLWFLPGEGIFTVGISLFDNTASLRKQAIALLDQRDEDLLKSRMRFARM